LPNISVKGISFKSYFLTDRHTHSGPLYGGLA